MSTSSPPRNQAEAESRAAEVFARAGFPLTVAETQARLQSEDAARQLLAALPELLPREHPNFDEVIDAISHLWNHTPRGERGGLTPSEELRARAEETERTLPAPDRPIWTTERLASLLEARKPASMLWALRWIGHHAEACKGIELLDAVSFLLAHEREGVAEKTLEQLSDLQAHPQAGEIARWVEARIPSLEARDPELHALALAALARLDAKSHVRQFLEAALHEDLGMQRAAIEGLVRSAAEQANAALLRLARKSWHAPSYCLAVAALFRLRDAPRVAEAAALAIEHIARDPDVELEDALWVVLEGFGPAIEPFFRVERALFDETPASGEPPESLSIFRPTTDPSARSRGDEALESEDGKRLEELVKASDFAALQVSLSRLAITAARRAASENPAFSGQAACIAAVANALSDAGPAARASGSNARILAGLAAVLLSTAIRGRDLRAEIDAAGDDRECWLALCDVDASWLDEESLVRASRALRQEDLLPMPRSSDPQALATRGWLLAAMDPGGSPELWRPAVIGDVSLDSGALQGLVRAAGDRLIPPLLEGIAGDFREDETAFLARALTLLGTERARATIELQLPRLVQLGLSAPLQIRLGQASGSVEAARGVVESIRRGAGGLEAAIAHPFLRGELHFELECLIELAGLRGDPDQILEDGERALEAAGKLKPDERHHEHAYETEGAHEDDDAIESYRPRWSDEGDEDDEAVPEPIVRDAPKIGRNDPCPCGSGKKHKKCCGK